MLRLGNPVTPDAPDAPVEICPSFTRSTRHPRAAEPLGPTVVRPRLYSLMRMGNGTWDMGGGRAELGWEGRQWGTPPDFQHLFSQGSGHQRAHQRDTTFSKLRSRTEEYRAAAALKGGPRRGDLGSAREPHPVSLRLKVDLSWLNW